MNCKCGKPLYHGEQLCEGCRKALLRDGHKQQRRFNRMNRDDELWRDVERTEKGYHKEEDEDASDVWADDAVEAEFSRKKRGAWRK